MRRGLILTAVVLALGALGACADDPPPVPAPSPKTVSVPGGTLSITYDEPISPEDLIAHLEAGGDPRYPPKRISLAPGVSFDMVLIPAGEFDMGSPETEEGRFNYEEEEALHRVRITKPFWLARTELTQAVWEAVMGSLSPFVGKGPLNKGPQLPMTYVTWDDSQAFLKRLSEKVPGGGFRLPTEAEWEYACRAGSATRFCFGDDKRVLAEYAWYTVNTPRGLHAGVGTLKPNAWGLYDMHGSVYEWCEDWSPYAVASDGAVSDPVGPGGSGRRARRGGAWGYPSEYLRCAARLSGEPSYGANDYSTGFRVARSVIVDAPNPQDPGNLPPVQPPAPKPGEPAPPVAPPVKEGEIPGWAKVAPEQIEAAKKAGVPVAFENSIGMRFVLIPAGTFTMGSPETEEGRETDETQHEVTLTKPYYLAVTEVTNGQYRRFKADHDSGEYQGVSLNGEEQPAVEVSWLDAVAFTEWLSDQDRERTYRLPTEAEWERACRAGTVGRWFWGADEAATGRYANVADRAMKARWGQALMQFWPESLGPWFVETDDGEAVAASVGKFLPNAYGLYDMVGNAQEQCEDWYAEYPIGAASNPMGTSGSRFGFRVFRGGSWHCPAGSVRAADRGRRSPGYSEGGVGFRLAAGVTVAEK